MVATSSLHFSPILHKPAIPHKSGLEPSPKVSCPTSLLPPTTITLPKSEHQPHLQPLATPLSLIPRQTMQQKSSFHHRQTKAKKAERSQIIVADTHCAKKDPPTTKKHWIKKYGLTWHHKKILDSGTKWLDDDLINASQKVLAKQFKHKFGGAGFQTTANGLCGNFTVKTGEFIQILPSGSDHWLAITTIGAKHPEVIVYDSLHSTVSDNVKAQIASLLCTQECAIRLNS